jgi:hypothetical protein
VQNAACNDGIKIKTKITAKAVTFVWCEGKQTLSRRFAERFDALGAHSLFDHASILHDRNLLQIRFECAIGCMLRE